MVGVVIISHGAFCEGLLDTLKMVGGDDFGVKAVPLFPGETTDTYREKLENALKENDQGQGVLVLSDIKGGTPYQSAAYLSKNHKMALVSGMNLPMLLTATVELTEEDTLDSLTERVTNKESFLIEGTVFGKGEKKHREKLSINKN
jgi:mannose PTS system EIIA component